MNDIAVRVLLVFITGLVLLTGYNFHASKEGGCLPATTSVFSAIISAGLIMPLGTWYILGMTLLTGLNLFAFFRSIKN